METTDTKTLEARETELIALVNSNAQLSEADYQANLKELAAIQTELLARWKPANPNDPEYCSECGEEIKILELSAGLCEDCQAAEAWY